MKKTILSAAIAASAFSTLALAQPHHEPYRTPHVVYDARFHHNHYYPRVGYGVAVLPPGHIALTWRGGAHYYFHGGVWYAPARAGFVVVRPPVGIVIPVLPPAYTTVYVSGTPYYYADDVYYTQAPGGYAVAQPPADAQIAQTPPPPAAPAPSPTAAAAPASTVWYYCDSSKSFYPYVSQCVEGWKQVPATPPR